MHRLGCRQLPPFLPQPQWLQTRVPCPDLGFSSRKGEFFENILPKLLLQFVTAPGARQWMPPYGLEAGDLSLQGVKVTRWGRRLPLFLPSAKLACMHAKSLRRV